jgi:hypothetical protein
MGKTIFDGEDNMYSGKEREVDRGEETTAARLRFSEPVMD